MLDRFIPLTATGPIKLQLATHELPPVSAAMRDHITRGWEQLQSYRPAYQNETLLRKVAHQDDEIQVAADISYRDIVGYRHAPCGVPPPWQAVTTMVLPVTADNYVTLQHRDSGDWPASYECVGWFLRSTQSTLTVDEIISTRLAIELSVTPLTMTPFVIFDSPTIAEFMVVYWAQLAETSTQLRTGSDRWCIPLAALGATLAAPNHTLHQPTTRVLEYLARHVAVAPA